jgi:hypothetical protein
MNLKEQIISELTQMNSQYADEVLRKYENIPILEKSLQDKNYRIDSLVKMKEDELKAIELQKIDSKRMIDQQITDMMNAKEAYIKSERNYFDMTSKLAEEVKKVDALKATTELNYKISEENKEQSGKLIENGDALVKRYNSLISSLKTDNEKLDLEKKKLAEEQAKLKISLTNLEQEKTEFYERVADINIRENSVIRAEKQLKTQEGLNARAKK